MTRTLLAIIAALPIAVAPLVVVVPATAMLVTGCAAVAPGSDSVVVNAERSIGIAFDVVDGFLRWEHANRAAVPSDVTKAADSLRREAPDAFRNARSVLRAYKSNRSPEQKALLDTWLATVTELANRAATYKR